MATNHEVGSSSLPGQANLNEVTIGILKPVVFCFMGVGKNQSWPMGGPS
jgi:hypothetical protein